MEVVGLMEEFWRGRRVLVTGHTGFKGGWLSLWLQMMGAEVHGLALDPPTRPSFFDSVDLGGRVASDRRIDILDACAVRQAFAEVRPQVVFHLAAQSLVRLSYADPVGTYMTNVMGTIHVLEAVRQQPGVQAAVVVTTDKCYENLEVERPYAETDALGGHDPYSSSKACAEIVTSSWRRSFLSGASVPVATARAGNVIGGGDWAADRLVPDVLRAVAQGAEMVVRYPDAVRPWQHVLEPLMGYLLLAQRLSVDGHAFAQAWNFGPRQDDCRPVRDVLGLASAMCPGLRWRHDGTPPLHEAGLLLLDSTKAQQRLGWHPRWRLNRALGATIDWHDALDAQRDMWAHSVGQIRQFMQA